MNAVRIAAAALALASFAPARAGVLIEGKGKGEDKQQRFLADGQKLRFESPGKHAMIFDGATKRSLQLDLADKTYTEFTAADIAKLRELMAQRGGAEKRKGHKLSFEKTGKTDKALGTSCDVYRMVDAEAKRDQKRTLCLAPFGSFGVSRADLDGFRAMGEFTSEMAGGELERNWADLPGVPLIGWDDDGQESFRATKVEKRSIPASEFTVPAGWTRKPGFAEQMEAMKKDPKAWQQGRGKAQGGRKGANGAPPAPAEDGAGASGGGAEK